MKRELYRIEFYAPADNVEAVKLAMFDAGAGKIGAYEHCAWQTLGQGQFKPGEGSNPFLGNTGELETVEEYKVEMVCNGEAVAAVIQAMKQAHPYEEPAYAVIRLEGY